jgi:general secretion pathway protein A
MYEEHFGLFRRPFSLTPDPEFLFWTEQHKKAFDLVCLSLLRHAPIAVVTGDVGAGKTTLIHALMQENSADHEVALLSNVVGDSGDLLRWILTAFGRETVPSTQAEALREVESFLRRVWEGGRRSVLIVDEAQNVSDSGIETLRLLTNLDVGKDTPLTLILAGQPELRDRLGRPDFKAFRQRLGASCHLGPMTLQETIGYVRTRIEIAGGEPDVMEAAAVEAVYRRAKGVPRLMNLLCDLCFVSAFAEGVRRVDAAFAEAVLAESLAIGGLGGLPAEEVASEVVEARQAAASQGAAMTARVAPALRVAEPRVLADAAGRAFGNARRRQSPPPSLRLVEDDHSNGKSDSKPEVALRLVPESTLPNDLDDGIAVVPRVPERSKDSATRPLERRSSWNWRGALGSVGGAALAASFAGVVMMLPATGRDSLDAWNFESASQAGPSAKTLTGPGAPAPAVADNATDIALGGPLEASLAPADPKSAEHLFRRALDEATIAPSDAAVTYARAAARGHRRAAYYLAQMYETGDGVRFAPDTAWTWYAVSADEVQGAHERLAELAALPGPEVGSVTPLYSSSGAGGIELVWEGRGSFVVELAAEPGDAPDAYYATPLTAVRLATPAGVAWWRVRAVGEEPSSWIPVDAGTTAAQLH